MCEPLSSFVGDLNFFHQEWLGSTTMNRHGAAAFDFATMFSSYQLVVGSTNGLDTALDPLITDVPNPILVSVIAPIVNSDYSSLPAVISMVRAVPNLFVIRKNF